MIPWLVLLACQPTLEDGDPAASPDGGAEADPPSGYVYEGDDAPPASFDAEALGLAIAEALAVAPGITGTPVLDAYFSMLDLADPDCPDWYEQDGNVFWYDVCTSDRGAFFDGYGFYYPYDEVDLDGSGTLWSGDYLYGVATIDAPEGDSFHTGGGVQVLTGYNPEYNGFTAMSQVQGGFLWTAPEAADTWIGAGLQPDLYLYGVDYPDYGGRGLYLEGGLAGLDGDATAVVFSGLLLYHEVLGSPCEDEPEGTISVRDADGRWWDVRFDTPPEGPMDADLCDGCGTASLGGVDQGQVCVDVSALLDWEITPW